MASLRCTRCQMCGRSNHLQVDCPFSAPPFYRRPSEPSGIQQMQHTLEIDALPSMPMMGQSSDTFRWIRAMEDWNRTASAWSQGMRVFLSQCEELLCILGTPQVDVNNDRTTVIFRSPDTPQVRATVHSALVNAKMKVEAPNYYSSSSRYAPLAPGNLLQDTFGTGHTLSNRMEFQQGSGEARSNLAPPVPPRDATLFPRAAMFGHNDYTHPQRFRVNEDADELAQIEAGVAELPTLRFYPHQDSRYMSLPVSALAVRNDVARANKQPSSVTTRSEVANQESDVPRGTDEKAEAPKSKPTKAMVGGKSKVKPKIPKDTRTITSRITKPKAPRKPRTTKVTATPKMGIKQDAVKEVASISINEPDQAGGDKEAREEEVEAVGTGVKAMEVGQEGGEEVPKNTHVSPNSRSLATS
ncbi:hypothetical protein BP6252_06159 [Coleophoma cylindrospora]|uniref:CCHC-type domain-containing protein n=1 Tax=Coleophoma cylindrospora TaxID=1849047 RepID=A0A3D8RLS9_9HELO|nr:hypothetical protein BP6252_06159 [Coleophoma cylindrospora]